MTEEVEVTIVKREPGPPYQGWMLNNLDEEAVRRLFEHKFGYLPREVLWDAIIKAGPILSAAQAAKAAGDG